jgi:hypothetical protein
LYFFFKMTKVPATKKLQKITSKKALWLFSSADQLTQVSHCLSVNKSNGLGSGPPNGRGAGLDEGLGMMNLSRHPCCSRWLASHGE